MSEAVQAIFDRHERHGDDRLPEMGYEPGEVLRYLRVNAHRWPAGLRADDLDENVAVLLLWQWWQEREEQLFWLEQVVKLGASRRDFAAVFGISSRQGFRDWLDRLHALLDETGPGRPDEQSARSDRRAAAAPSLYGGEQEWLVAHLGEYLAVALKLVELYMLVDEDTADSIAEVRRDLRAEAYGDQEHLLVLGLAMDALADATVDVPLRRLDDGEVHDEQELAENRQRVDAATAEVAGLLRRYADLQRRRLAAVTW